VTFDARKPLDAIRLTQQLAECKHKLPYLVSFIDILKFYTKVSNV